MRVWVALENPRVTHDNHYPWYPSFVIVVIRMVLKQVLKVSYKGINEIKTYKNVWYMVVTRKKGQQRVLLTRCGDA